MASNLLYRRVGTLAAATVLGLPVTGMLFTGSAFAASSAVSPAGNGVGQGNGQGNAQGNGSHGNGNGNGNAYGHANDDTTSVTAPAGSSSSNASDHQSAGTAGTSGAPTTPQPLSYADQNPGGANNGGHCGSYCSTRDGSPSMNGNGNGAATGKPCAGCVGKADNKNPKGQAPNGSDHNNGYECDGNHGIGRSNPAHTGCTGSTPQPPATPQHPQHPQHPVTPRTPEAPHSSDSAPGSAESSAHPKCSTSMTGTSTGASAHDADCTVVLGEKTARAAAPATPVTPRVRAVSAASLPFTGAPITALAILGAATAAIGTGITFGGRRRSSTA